MDIVVVGEGILTQCLNNNWKQKLWCVVCRLACAISSFCRCNFVTARGMECHFNYAGSVQMKRLLCIALCLGLLLTGCNTTILVATSLGESKHHLEYYKILGWTSETRRQDSAECGGPPNESIQFGSNAIKAAQRSEETERQTELRLNQEWHACMTEKGYRDARASSR
jgi:hypothetical protein